jgi:hypothetical protein
VVQAHDQQVYRDAAALLRRCILMPSVVSSKPALGGERSAIRLLAGSQNPAVAQSWPAHIAAGIGAWVQKWSGCGCLLFLCCFLQQTGRPTECRLRPRATDFVGAALKEVMWCVCGERREEIWCFPNSPASLPTDAKCCWRNRQWGAALISSFRSGWTHRHGRCLPVLKADFRALSSCTRTQ